MAQWEVCFPFRCCWRGVTLGSATLLEVLPFRRDTKSGVWPPVVITSPKMLSVRMKVLSSVSLLVPSSCFYWALGIFKMKGSSCSLKHSEPNLPLYIHELCVKSWWRPQKVPRVKLAVVRQCCSSRVAERFHCRARSSAATACCSCSAQWKKPLQVETWSFRCNQNDPYFPTWSNIVSLNRLKVTCHLYVIVYI